MNEQIIPEGRSQHPRWFLEMAQDMLDMRDAQREYFEQPNNYRLSVAKAKEKKVDNWMDRMRKAGLINHKAKPVQQQKQLF